jgi:hypothetical protein
MGQQLPADWEPDALPIADGANALSEQNSRGSLSWCSWAICAGLATRKRLPSPLPRCAFLRLEVIRSNSVVGPDPIKATNSKTSKIFLLT